MNLTRKRGNYPRFCHSPKKRRRVVIYLLYSGILWTNCPKFQKYQGFSSRFGCYPIGGASCDGSKPLNGSLPHPPCSPQPAQSPSHRHCWQRWCALTAPFQPLPVAYRPSAGMLAVAVLRRVPLTRTRPHLRFRGVAFLPWQGGESGSSSEGTSLQRRPMTRYSVGSDPPGTRTLNPRIKSAMLYH